MKYFFDTEFIDRGRTYPLEILSIGMMSEDRRRLYLVRKSQGIWNIVRRMKDQWLQKNVVPVLYNFPPTVLGIEVIEFGDQILKFIQDDPHPEFWGYYADYDWVLFCQLFGRMVDLPQKFPQMCYDIRQELNNANLRHITMADVIIEGEVEHNALQDAILTKRLYDRYLAS